MEIEGIEIRPFKPDEWHVYRAVRLKALETDPKFFCESYDDAKAKPDEHYQAHLLDANSAVFGVFRHGDVIGMTGIVIDKEDASGQTANLWGSWLEPAWRGKGLARRMYEARLNWAKARPGVKRVTVSHRKSNAISKKANQRWGFTFTHAREILWPGNQKETEFCYELKLN